MVNSVVTLNNIDNAFDRFVKDVVDTYCDEFCNVCVDDIMFSGVSKRLAKRVLSKKKFAKYNNARNAYKQKEAAND